MCVCNVDWMAEEIMTIKIRFNTDKFKDDSLPPWRVIYNGKQRLAEQIIISTPAFTSVDEIAPGVLKWHITCEGTAIWDGVGVCTVLADERDVDSLRGRVGMWSLHFPMEITTEGERIIFSTATGKRIASPLAADANVWFDGFTSALALQSPMLLYQSEESELAGSGI